MKKIILPIVLFSLLIPSLYSQITINGDDLPSAGDTLRYSLTINPQQYDFLQTGEDFQWDFSGLTHQSQAIEEYELVSGINFLMGIIFGSDAIATSAFGDLPLDDFEIEVDGIYTVFSDETQYYTNDGFFVLLDGFGLPLKYSEPDIVYTLPLNFGDQDSTAFFGNTNLGDTLSLTRQGYRISEVDGWGNIITPYGEFDALRIKSTIYETDSVYWESFGEPVMLSRTITRYSWLAKDEKIPVLEVSFTTFDGSDESPALSIKYRDIYREPSDEDPPVANFDANTTNAFTDEEITLFNYSTPSHEVNNYSWTFIPGNVNFHNNTDATSAEPVISFSEPGTYTVKLVAENEAGIDSLTRIDFLTITLPTG
ncbi:MAG: PKD domain-containing protein, partial [Bacteroidales bacterium]